MPIPKKILAMAYVSPGAKELAWRPGDVPAVCAKLAAAGYAIRGGEVWIVADQWSGWDGSIPLRKGAPAPTGFFSWSSGPRLYGKESWKQFCERMARLALEQMAALTLEELILEKALPYIWVHLSLDEELPLD